MDPETTETRWRPFASPRFGAWVTGAVLLLTAGVFLLQALPASAAWLAGIDGAWHARMVRAETPLGSGVASALQVVGSAWVMVPLYVLVAVFLWTRRLGDRFLFWVLASLSGQFLALLLKAAYTKARPADGLSHVINTAFPSGHTATAASIAFGLVVVAFVPGRARRWLVPVALLWTLGMAWSRTYLRDHWLSDTVAGFLLGLSCVLVAAVVVSWRMERRA